MRTLALATLTVLLAAGSAGPAPAFLPAPVAAVARQEGFMDKFRQAIKINSKPEMARLVRTNQVEAIDSIVSICEAIAQQSSERLEKEIAALREAWEEVFDTSFVDEMYEYFSLLPHDVKSARTTLRGRFTVQFKNFRKVSEEKTLHELTGIGLEFEGLAKAFEEIGDSYMASQSWSHYALCFDEPLRGKDADLKRACEGWGRSVTARERVQLKDSHYGQAKERFDSLEAAGYGDPAKAAPGKGEKPAPGAPTPAVAEAASGAVVAPTSFELALDLEALTRPSYNIDETYPTWPGIYLQGVGSTGGFINMETGPTILRAAASKVAIDVNKDGAYQEDVDVEIPVTGILGPVQLVLGAGETEREWAFLATVGQSQDTYQGFRSNLAPDSNQLTVYMAPAASVVATIAGTRVQVFDDNLDGRYGSPATSRAYVGTREGSFQPEMDSVVVGDAKTAAPWSDYLQIGPTWYRMESQREGAAIAATPVEVEIGTLALDFGGGKPDWVVVRGTGDRNGVMFDIAAGGGKGVEVPVGSYELYAGRFSKGKRSQLAKALILPGKNTLTWSVSAGGKTTAELGAPFGFDFEFTQDEQSVTVKGPSVVVTGRGHETYQRLWNCVPTPDVFLRRAGTKRATDDEAMRTAESAEDLTDKGYPSAWFPFDLSIEKKKEGEALEVQLVEKKNKLFGKIESDWRP
jgi:hypothetical protein